jgi:mannose-6-phosphate isomerase-like protein (cupin superfamily)
MVKGFQKDNLMNRCFQIIRQLLRDASLYIDLISPNIDEIRICIKLSDTEESATLVLGKETTVLEGSVNPDSDIIMEKLVLEKIAEGKTDAFALAGRGRADEKRPIEFEIHTKERTKEIWETIKALLTYFFTPGKIKIKNLHPKLAGHAHGAHPIPLVYWNGMRYSWIHIKQGETLNKEGEKDPYPQTVIILEGAGKGTIGDETFNIKPQTVLYIPTNTIHQITAEEDVELLWLAWNAW